MNAPPNGRSKAQARIASFMTDEELRQVNRIKALYSQHVKSRRDDKVYALYKRLLKNTQTDVAKLAGIVVMGFSGSGKSHLIKRMAAHAEFLPAFQAYRDEDEPDFDMLPYISLDAPPKATPAQLLAAIIRKCGCPVSKPGSVAEMVELAMKWFERRRVMFVHIDEFQHVLRTMTEGQIKDAQDAIKELIQLNAPWPVQIILSGTPELSEFRKGDDQLRTRTLPHELESLTVEKDVAVVLKVTNGVITNHANLTPVDLDNTQFGKQLMRASNYQFGNVIQIVRLACEEAIMVDRDQVGLQDFANVYDLLVGARGDDMNMFLSANWEKLHIPTVIVEGTAFKKARRKKRTFEVS